MTTRMIIAEVSLSSFLLDVQTNENILSHCDVVHLTSGLIDGDDLHKVLYFLGHTKENQNIKLSMSLRSNADIGDLDISTLSITVPSADMIDKINRIIDEVDYFELDARCDLIPSILSLIPPHKRIITRRITTDDGGYTDLTSVGYEYIMQQYQSDKRVNAFLYRYICDNGLAAVEFLHHINQDNVIAYDENEDGLWSRICASYKGSAVIFANIDEGSQISLDQLVKNYNIDALPDKITTLYGIIGANIGKSFSPLVHNKGLRALHLSAIYLPFKIDSLSELSSFLKRCTSIDLPIKGLTVTAPLKAIIHGEYPGARSIVQTTHSANVLMVKDGQTLVETTDDIGLDYILKQQNITVKGKHIAVLGSGCSGRIAAYTLSKQGAHVTLFNRSAERATLAHKLLKLSSKVLDTLKTDDFDVLVNTVPFEEQSDITFDINRLNSRTIYIDFVYNPYPNCLLVQARLNGLQVIDGLIMLKNQLFSQFYSLTGKTLPTQASLALDTILSNKLKTDSSTNKTLNPCVDKVS